MVWAREDLRALTINVLMLRVFFPESLLYKMIFLSGKLAEF